MSRETFSVHASSRASAQERAALRRSTKYVKKRGRTRVPKSAACCVALLFHTSGKVFFLVRSFFLDARVDKLSEAKRSVQRIQEKVENKTSNQKKKNTGARQCSSLFFCAKFSTRVGSTPTCKRILHESEKNFAAKKMKTRRTLTGASVRTRPSV